MRHKDACFTEAMRRSGNERLFYFQATTESGQRDNSKKEIVRMTTSFLLAPGSGERAFFIFVAINVFSVKIATKGDKKGDKNG